MEDKKRTVSYRDIGKFALHYWKPEKSLGLWSVFFIIISVIAESIIPVYTGQIIDAMSNATIDNSGAWSDVWFAFWMFVLLALSHSFFYYITMLLWTHFSVETMQQIVTDGMYKVQRFNSEWHANEFAGGTVRKLTRGMRAFETFQDVWLMSLLPAVTVLISITIMLSLKIYLVGMITAILIIFYCIISVWISVVILAPKFKESAKTDTALGAFLSDSITGNETVKTFGAEDVEDKLFNNVSQEWRKKNLTAWVFGVSTDFFRSVFTTFMNSVIIGTSLWFWHSGEMTTGDIVTVITTIFIISSYVRNIGHQISTLQRAVSDMDDVVAFWLRDEEIVDAEGAKPLVIESGSKGDMICFNNVDFKYPNVDRDIYKSLSINIKNGEKLALVGKSGGGKSTFIKLLQRLYNINGGEITIAGQDISKVTLKSLRRSISLVPQDPVLFHRSIAENISYARPDSSMEDIVVAAKKAHAHEFIAGLREGYNTLVGERGVKLSGGERQRVAIARAILANKPILILDEATSSLDSISEYYIKEALEELIKGRTTITVAHRLSTIQQADRILVFSSGEIIEEGNHEALMAMPKSYYKKLYDTQTLSSE